MITTWLHDSSKEITEITQVAEKTQNSMYKNEGSKKKKTHESFKSIKH